MSESSKWMALDRGWPRIIIHKVYCNVHITDSVVTVIIDFLSKWALHACHENEI